VYGRLCDCAYVKRPSDASVVSTALSCTTNLSSTVVVSNRSSAIAVLHHLQSSKTGSVKCLIVDEAHNSAQAKLRNLPIAWQSMLGVDSLFEAVEATEGCEATLPVIQNLLASWVVAPDWQTAVQCLQGQQHHKHSFGIVTRC
jgi:hypothetical protein